MTHDILSSLPICLLIDVFLPFSFKIIINLLVLSLSLCYLLSVCFFCFFLFCFSFFLPSCRSLEHFFFRFSYYVILFIPFLRISLCITFLVVALGIQYTYTSYYNVTITTLTEELKSYYHICLFTLTFKM